MASKDSKLGLIVIEKFKFFQDSLKNAKYQFHVQNYSPHGDVLYWALGSQSDLSEDD